jgi:hypothetical protein
VWPLSELAPNAPDSYTVKRGDTLWDISSPVPQSPWRWPELWGMNLQDIRNPHRIFPGQVLVLTPQRRARLLPARRCRDGVPHGAGVAPHPPKAWPTPPFRPFPCSAIEPFLTEP